MPRPDDQEAARPIGRRSFLAGAGAFTLAIGWGWNRLSVPGRVTARASEPDLVKIVEFTDDGRRTGVVRVPKIVKTESEWRKQLSPASFEITRRDGTERPFSGSLLDVHDKGVFRCICCDTALFDSATKYDSGTGWPSFWQPIAPENIVEKADTSLGMTRTAVSCRRCDAHLGHVFDDGPRPTGLRYCMNSVALRFARAT
jgi:peptide-methionine (R)-S-oxide reductase